MKSRFINEPLHGVAVYNPDILSKQELIRLFVARRVLLQQILDDLHREKMTGIPQHRLLVGARGMGKTTMLRRISYAIEDDADLSKIWLPLTFPEEQYNVARLSDLWLNCLDALSDALERQGKHVEAEALDEIIDGLPGRNEEEHASKALSALLEQAQKIGKRLLLLFDNIDLILDRLAKEHWTIREMLSREGAPLLIGATSRPLEATYEYKGAFYDFFKINNLNKLQLDEMREVLGALAIEMNAPHVSRLLEQEPGRIRVLYDLTGGNPRTSVLLFSVLSQGIDGDVRSDLERLLDQCTPLYKARFEELSNQAQQVVDALALHWDPAPAAAVAERAHLDVNIVSSHLNRLLEQGIVEKVRLYPKKKTGFQITERFFNIWYLMRASRRMRRKLIWLSKFLKSFYSQEDLHNLARRYLDKKQTNDGTSLLKHAEYGFALAEALDDKGWRRALEHSASRITLDIHDKFRELLSDSAIDLDEIDQQALNMKQIREKILNAKVDWGDIDKNEFSELFCGMPEIATETKSKFAEVFEGLSKENIEEGYRIFAKAKNSVTAYTKDDSVVDLVYRAISMGLMESWDDVEGAESAQHVLGAPALLTMALGRKLAKNQDDGSLGSFKAHLKKSKCRYSWAWAWLGDVEAGVKHYEEAEQSYRKSLNLLSSDPDSWFKLGALLGDDLNRPEDAEQAIGKAIELAPEDVNYLGKLALIQLDLNRVKEAEDTIRRAIKIDPKQPFLWNLLGGILGKSDRLVEAVAAFKTCLKINNNEPNARVGLGLTLLFKSRKNSKKAERLFKKAIECDPNNINAWNNLALLLEINSRFQEAEQAYRQALQLVPDDASQQLRLASMLAVNKKWPEAAMLAASLLQSNTDAEDNLLEAALPFFKSCVVSGYTKEAVILLEKSEFHESWRPLVEALNAILARSRDYFLNIAPEVRPAAEEIYDMLAGNDEKVPDEDK